MLQKQGLLKEGIPQLTPPVTPKKLGTRPVKSLMRPLHHIAVIIKDLKIYADFLQMAKKVSIKMEQF